MATAVPKEFQKQKIMTKSKDNGDNGMLLKNTEWWNQFYPSLNIGGKLIESITR